jgi:SUMO ligase MMS21 Smc5/6 complex component
MENWRRRCISLRCFFIFSHCLRIFYHSFISLFAGASFFCFKAAGAQNAGDDDVQVVAGSGLQLTCPITQKTLVQPVRNLACKHCYEQAAITEALERHAKSAKRSADMKCPVAGCGEKVSKRSIQRSQSKEAEVKRALKRQAAQSSSSQETAGEDDGLDLT